MLAAVAVVDMLVGHTVGLLTLLSLGPAFAAVVGGLIRMIVVSSLALLLCVVLATYQDFFNSLDDRLAFLSVHGVSVAGVIASTLRQRQERELSAVRTVAAAAQQGLLRPVPAGSGPVKIAVRYISATSRATIGGDLYEVIAAADATRLIIGDVQGKGLAAVQTAATVLGAFREAAHDAPDLPALAARIEFSLQRQAAGEEFVTAILAQVADGGPGIEILNCGHPPPLLLSSSGVRFVEPLDAGLPFGLAGLAAAGLAAAGRGLDAAAFGPGDQILFYTDGISEARDKSGAFYQFGDCGTLLDGLGPDAALDRLCEDVVRHVGHELRDDAAMLLISHGPGEPRPGNGQAATGASHPESFPGEIMRDTAIQNAQTGPAAVDRA